MRCAQRRRKMKKDRHHVGLFPSIKTTITTFFRTLIAVYLLNPGGFFFFISIGEQLYQPLYDNITRAPSGWFSALVKFLNFILNRDKYQVPPRFLSAREDNLFQVLPAQEAV